MTSFWEENMRELIAILEQEKISLDSKSTTDKKNW